MIRFIVETQSSAFNRSGNRTHCAVITSTLTGKQLLLRIDGPRNAVGLLRNLLKLDYSFVYEVHS